MVFRHAPCPMLPTVAEPLAPGWSRVAAEEAGERFYEQSLCLAQSYWRRGKPAQAILQLNKAFMADLVGDEAVLRVWPLPYGVLNWMLRNRPAGSFVGNPVRHFQHLATRVSGPRRELRAWRAWACYYLAIKVLPEDEFPPDREQLQQEGLEIPAWERVLDELRRLGLRGEVGLLDGVAQGL